MDIKLFHKMISQGNNLDNQLVRISLIDSFEWDSDVIKADLIFKYFDYFRDEIYAHYQLNKKGKRKNSLLYALMIYTSGDHSVKKFLIDYLEEAEEDEIVMIINRLQEFEPIVQEFVLKKLDSVAIKNTDFLTFLMGYIKTHNLKLPNTLLQRLKLEKPDWQVSRILLDDFNLRI